MPSRAVPCGRKLRSSNVHSQWASASTRSGEPAISTARWPRASVLSSIGGRAVTSAAVDRFELCVELFDGNDPAAVAAARTRWTAYLAAGHALTYYQQDEAGRWQKKS